MERYRWLTSLLIAIIATLGALGLTRGAAAQTLPIAGPAAGHHADVEEEEEAEEKDEFEFGGEDEAEAGDECEFEDEALEEACEEKAEEREEREAAELETEECRLQSAAATVATVPGRDQLRLTIRYRTFEPSAVAVALQLRGGKGALDLGTNTVRFGRTGTLHTDKTLSDAQMARAMAAKEFTVGLHAVNTPGFCGKAFERHLTARQDTGPGLRWSDPSASARASRSANR